MYKEIAKRYNELYGEEQLKKLKIISEYLIVKPNYKLLDVGCGIGISTNYFKCITTGIDNNLEMIKNGKGNLIIADAEKKLPFNDKTFDIIIILTVIHHIKKLNKLIKEIKRIIKPDGQIVITILKKSINSESIKNKLINNFTLKEEIEEEKDWIFILSKF